MKTSGIVNVNVNKLCKRITMTVKIRGMVRFKIKLFIAKILIRLACWVTGFGLKVEDRGAH